MHLLGNGIMNIPFMFIKCLRQIFPIFPVAHLRPHRVKRNFAPKNYSLLHLHLKAMQVYSSMSSVTSGASGEGKREGGGTNAAQSRFAGGCGSITYV